MSLGPGRGTWQLRGPVRVLELERAETDPLTSNWAPPQGRITVMFDRDGRVTTQTYVNPDGSAAVTAYSYDPEGRLHDVRWEADGRVTSTRVYQYDETGRLLGWQAIRADGTVDHAERCTYDEQGRRTARRSLPVLPGHSAAYAPEGSDLLYGAPGAVVMTTISDEHDRALEAAFEDGNGKVVRRVVFTRDSDGRVVREECFMAPPGPDGFEVALDGAPAEEREQLLGILSELSGPRHILSTITFSYDAAGRLLERTRHFLGLNEQRTTFAYDAHGGVAEEQHEERRRGLQSREGVVRTNEDPVLRHAVRYDYRYDSYRNWIEKSTSIRHDPETSFRRGSVERRILSYFG